MVSRVGFVRDTSEITLLFAVPEKSEVLKIGAIDAYFVTRPLRGKPQPQK